MATLVDVGSDDDSDDQVSWTATIDLPIGETSIDVEVVDDEGLSNVPENPTLISRLQLPTTLMKGGAGELLALQNYSPSYKLELDTLAATELGEFSVNWAPALDPATNHILSADVNAGVLQIISTPVDGGLNEVEASISLNHDSATWSFTNVISSAFDAGSRRYFVMVTRFPIDQSINVEESEVYSFDVQSKALSLVTSQAVDDREAFSGSAIVWADSKLFALESLNSLNVGIIEIDVDSGLRSSMIATLDNTAVLLTADSNNSALYAVGITSIAKIVLADSTVSYFSEGVDNLDSPFDQPRSAVFDLSGNRIWVGDDGVNTVYAVDLDSGTRTVPVKAGVGDGGPLQFPRDLALSGDALLVLDDQGNAPSKLFSIDLDSGDRTTLINIEGGNGAGASGLVVAEDGLVYYGTNNEIYSYDPTTEVKRQLLGAGVGTGVVVGSVTSFSLDEVGERLLVADYVNGHIIAVDIATLHRSSAYRYEDLSVTLVTDFVVTSEGLYVLDGARGELSFYNFLTGDKSVLADTCMNRIGQNVMSFDYNSLNTVTIRADGKEALLGGSPMVRFDLENNVCSLVERGSYLVSAVYVDGDKILAGAQNRIVNIDLPSGESVTISKL
ncbi:hypothetical protein R50072_26350 [Simiduia litorea]